NEATRLVPADELVSVADRSTVATPAPDRAADPHNLVAIAPTATASLPAPAASVAGAAVAPALHGSDVIAIQKDGFANGRTPRNLLLGIAATVIVSLLAAGVWWVWSPSSYQVASIKAQSVPTREPEAPAQREAALAPSIVVMPFNNLSGDA